MILHQIGRELEAQLVAKKCPFKVFDRETTKPAGTWGPMRVVIEHDPDKDAFGPPRLSRNPRIHATHIMACKLSIYGRSSKPAALEEEHKGVVKQMLHQVIVGMRYVAAARLDRYKETGGGFFTPDDLEQSERDNGAAYRLFFTFDCPVAELTWAGEAAQEFTFGAGSIKSTTKVGNAGVPDEEAEPTTACGA